MSANEPPFDCPECGHTMVVHHPDPLKGCGLCACGPVPLNDERLAIVIAAGKWAQAAWWGPTSDVLHQAEDELLSAVLAHIAALIATGDVDAQ